MMLLSVIGITWVQIIWIRNAIEIRNKNFNSAVFVSLNNAANEIESSRKMNFFNNFIHTDQFSMTDSSGNFTGFVSIDKYGSESAGSLQVNINKKTDIPVKYGNNGNLNSNKNLRTSNDTSTLSDSVSLLIASPENPGSMVMVRKGEKLKLNSGSVYIKQKEFLDWVKKRADEFQNLSDRMISEIFEWEKTMELDNKEIGYSLHKYFIYSGIQTPFEFAVIKNGKVNSGYFKKAHSDDFLESPYKVSLFPDNIIRQDVILSVVFPEQTNYVLGSMAWILGGSTLFSLFIFATFALSLFFLIRQKKISEMKSDFINNMTHEFKTPIATISLAADTITNPKVIRDENTIRHFIGMIKKENSRMNKQVETILQIASLDKKEIEFNFEKVSLHSIIEKAIDTIDIQVQQRQGTIKINLNASQDIIIGDSEHLTNLVHNLLDNAIKYSAAAPEITVSTKDGEEGIIFSVVDKGIGMSKSVQSKIFERFYRQSSGNIHNIKGFGLGLNYVRAIIDAHKGNITVHSEPGKGSIFEICLPFKLEN